MDVSSNNSCWWTMPPLLLFYWALLRISKMGIFTYFGCFSARAILSESGSFARITEQLFSLAVFIARSYLQKKKTQFYYSSFKWQQRGLLHPVSISYVCCGRFNLCYHYPSLSLPFPYYSQPSTKGHLFTMTTFPLSPRWLLWRGNWSIHK